MISGPVLPPMDIGGNLVSTSKTSNIKSLLLEAWRQRWSPIDWAVNIKQVLPRGVSGDVYDLSNCILIQALIGPAPNPLFISYLNHCISSHVVSYGAVLSSISKYQEFSKSQCIICLLDLCNQLKKRINCYGNEEECISLCKAIVALVHWLFSGLHHALVKISELKSSASNQNTNQFGNLGHHHASLSALSGSLGVSGAAAITGNNSQLNEFISIVEKSCEVLSYIQSTPFIQALFYVGKMEDQTVYSQLVAKVNKVEALLNQSSGPCFPSTLTNAKELSDTITNFLNAKSQNQDPALVATEILAARELAKGPVIHCSSPSSLFGLSCNAIIAINAILYPTNEIRAFARQISLVARFNDIPYAEVCLEIVRSCFIGLVDSASSDLKLDEDLKWGAFTFLKVPLIFVELDFPNMDKKNLSTELEKGLDKLLMFTPLLDLTDSKSNCDCLDLFSKELCATEDNIDQKHRILTAEQKNRIMTKRHKDSHKLKDKMIGPNPVSGGQGASLILKADPTVTTIFKTLDHDYSKNQDGLLGVLNHMVGKSKMLQLILNAAAANGNLKSFTVKLIKFNELNKQINGENGKQSQTRALLFDITFLMLCHIAQNYGSDFITQNAETKDSFFATWCAQLLPEGGKYRSPDVLLSSCDLLKVDNLLSQFAAPDFELKTSLVKWHEVCLNAPAAIKEVLLAWEHGIITADNVKTILDNVKSKMCCLPVVISAWLSSYINTLPHEERIKPMSMIQQFMTPASFRETTGPGSSSSSNNLVSSSSGITGNNNNNGTTGGGGANGGGSGNNSTGSVEGNAPSSNEPANTYYSERSMLMSNIIKKVFWNINWTPQSKGKGALSTIPHGLTSDKALWELLEDTFMSAHNRSWLDQRDVYNIDTVFCVGGPNWFVESLLRLLLKFDHSTELNKAVGLIYGLFHLDIEQCALALLANGLVGNILNENKQEALTEPKASALAKLAVMTVLAALAESEESRSVGSKISLKRHGYQRDVFMEFVPMEVDPNKLNNIQHNNERPNKMRRFETSGSLNIQVEDTPFLYAMNQQSVDPRILNEPLTKAIADLLRLLSTIIADSVVSQRTLFPLIFLEQLILCGKQDAHKILQFLPFQAISRLIKMMPGSLTYEFLLSISNLQTPKARKIIARALCQLKTAKVDIP